MNTPPAYETTLGAAYCGDSRSLITELSDESVSLVLTSPPFALQRQKEYREIAQADYVDWLTDFAALVKPKLRDDGSLVVDLGGAYEQGTPSRSLYNFRVLLRVCDDVGFTLAQDFYWHNPSKLPSPIEWVNKRKVRVKDTVNTVWWFSKTPWPKADISKVLTEYSDRMKKLLRDPEAFYSPKVRPSGHDIGTSFSKDNGGAIPANLLQIPNTESNGVYLGACKALGIKPHPARFPARLPQFFIRMLTNPRDLVVDIFAGSNTTGMVAEQEGRLWKAFDERLDYLASSAFRFLNAETTPVEARAIHDSILSGNSLKLKPAPQEVLDL